MEADLKTKCVRKPVNNLKTKEHRPPYQRVGIVYVAAQVRLVKEALLPSLSESVLEGEVSCDLAKGKLRIFENDVIGTPGVARAHTLDTVMTNGQVVVRMVVNGDQNR